MPAKIRILLAIGEMSGGGSQRQLLYILQHLDRARFAPHLYLITPGGDLLPEVPADVPIHIFGSTYQPPPWRYPGQAHRGRVRHLASVLDEQQIDCLYDRTYHMTLVAAAAARRRPTRRISVVVTDPARDFETNPERFRPFKRWLLRRAYQSADRVVGVSKGVLQSAVERYRLDPAKTETLYNGFEIDRIDRLMIESLPPNQQKRPGSFEIVAAGRLHPQKGFGDLLHAVNELVHRRGFDHLHVRILGIGPLQAELQALAAKLNLHAHVTFAGFRSNPLPYYRQANLFCLPSHYEGFPNALVEAILCGTPVLATDCPSGPREILVSGQFGRLVPLARPTALAAAIAEAIHDQSSLRQTQSALARRHIETNFSLASSIQRLETLVSELVSSGL